MAESVALGAELQDLSFPSAQDWWVHWHDFATLWKNQPTYILSQASYLFGALATLVHALTTRGRWPYLWVAIILHGLVIESLSYFVPDVDNFWHSQTPLIFLGRRLPLHIIFLYSVFYYHAFVGVAKLRLPRWAEPFAVGLTVVLVDLPYDITSVKFVHWTWHDTDPNIEDRHYWVPWNSYYFHATFAAGFTWWFHVLRGQERWQSSGVGKNLLNVLLSGLLGTPTGVLFFTALYHPMHDLYKVHSEVTFFVVFAVFLALAWAGSRSREAVAAAAPASGAGGISWTSWLLLLHLVLHYALWLGMTIVGHPETEVSVGLHERLGKCGIKVPVQTASGLVLEKSKFLCKTDYDEKYFDFHCLPGGRPPKDGAHWYTICGTPFENRAEYILIMGAIAVVAAIVFHTMHFRGAPDSALNPKSAPAKKLKTK
ncbi:Phosphoribosylamine--glycine ligase [Frankliniella fusca]|uniref:Phosphoribosylamine--glycine ligase n=1 Tax=Frankliniella fusca TaxID=407009 RepID=A0AAE1LMR5_9NEOP|nr:Phosphoribosylamine--glycine ligase [Frankliniella fusca]